MTAEQPDQAAYDRHRKAAGERQRKISAAGQDIGTVPAVANPERRASCERDLKRFILTYLRNETAYNLPFATYHDKIIARAEQVTLEGGRFALAAPRGGAKSSLCEACALWAILYGLRRYVALFGASLSAIEPSLESIRRELETNEKIIEDFPEICYPIQCLGGSNHRKLLHRGKRVSLKLSSKKITLPSTAGPAENSVLEIFGITGRFRGRKFKTAARQMLRPDMALVDDFQDEDSARNPASCVKRLKIITSGIIWMAGPGKELACLAPCTIIEKGDAAAQLLDDKLHPEWNGERFRMLESLPSNLELWDEYAAILKEDMRCKRGTARATEFYRQRQAEMDAGAVASWPERFKPGEISAIQSAMNFKILDPVGFAAEGQNEPEDDSDSEDVRQLAVDDVLDRLNGLDRGVVPADATRLTAGIDVQDRLVFFVVVAWNNTFGGAIIDYGSFPRQRRLYYTYRDAPITFETAYTGQRIEAQIRAGLDGLAELLCGRPWQRADGTSAFVERCLVDANYRTDVVKKFCLETRHKAIIKPSHGKGITATGQPLTARKRQPGEQFGLNWIEPLARGAIRHVLVDTNFWKSFLRARLQVGVGDPSALALFGSKPEQHRMLADNFTAERSVRGQKANDPGGREVDEWHQIVGRDNHLWDCLILAAVAASIQGVNLSELPSGGAPRRQRRQVSFSELQRQARDKAAGRPAAPASADPPAAAAQTSVPAPEAAKQPTASEPPAAATAPAAQQPAQPQQEAARPRRVSFRQLQEEARAKREGR